MMMMKLAPWMALFFLLLPGQNLQAAPEATGPVHLPMTQLEGGHWMVQLDVNRQLTYPFILDTAAQAHVIPTELVERLKIDPAKLQAVEVHGASGKTQLKMAQLDALGAADQQIGTSQAVIQDLGHLGSGDGPPPAVAGMSFLSQFLLDFDLEKKVLTLHDPSTNVKDLLPKTPFNSVPFKRHLGFMIFEAQLDGQMLSAIFDSGAGRRKLINWAAAKALGVDKDHADLVKGNPLTGVSSKPMPSFKFPFKQLQIGDISQKDPEMDIADMPAFAALGMNGEPALNMSLLGMGRNRVLLDFKGNRIWLSQTMF